MQKILLLIGHTAHTDTLQEILKDQYAILQVTSCTQAASTLDAHPGEFAAIVTSPIFAEAMCRLSTRHILPVIAVGEKFSPEAEVHLLSQGVNELCDLFCSTPLILRRLENAIALYHQVSSADSALPAAQQAQEGLRLSLERHEIIMSQTNDIIFELDLSTDTLSCSPKWMERFGYPHISTQASKLLLSHSHIHPEDIPTLARKLEQFRSGTRYLEMEIRISNAAGQYTWSRLRTTAQQDQDGNAIKLVGVIIDIDQEKRISQALLDEAARDPLTKLYNRNASRRQIDDYLNTRSAGEQAALLVIDLDNFKDVNDHYGHMYGDAVLVQVSAEICNFFRGNDVISRIGGDEFIILMKNIPGRALVEGRCRDLISSIQQLHQEGHHAPPLSCSIGIALIPEHGITYQDLFQRADRALYKAKTLSKGCFVFHDPDSNASCLHSVPVVKNTLGVTATLSGHINLIRHISTLFYESHDMEQTILSILELAGKHVNASRAYIFENDPENRFCSNTFEWCNEGITAYQETLQHLSYEDELLHYQNHFNERGIFCCSNVTMLPSPQKELLLQQNIKSLLQCAIQDRGVFRGFIGFDECMEHHLWTQDQIDLLMLLSQMLSLFLLKHRALPSPPEKTEPC